MNIIGILKSSRAKLKLNITLVNHHIVVSEERIYNYLVLVLENQNEIEMLHILVFYFAENCFHNVSVPHL